MKFYSLINQWVKQVSIITGFFTHLLKMEALINTLSQDL